jgi:hypothetical protein
VSLKENSTTTELDTHADTCCFGHNCYLLSTDLSQTATVTGFSETLGKMVTPIASVAVAYDDPHTHTTYILVFNQVLYIDTMEHNLISPFQMRMNDIIVNDTPLTAMVQTQVLQHIRYCVGRLIYRYHWHSKEQQVTL